MFLRLEILGMYLELGQDTPEKDEKPETPTPVDSNYPMSVEATERDEFGFRQPAQQEYDQK